ncbi:MAG: nuclear transport factor 2 family protein, partial [Ignavibacteriaceae bacterium]|nr:nuclear transport factor 2 family protein [Ignavibacteriaceae bacterium]
MQSEKEKSAHEAYKKFLDIMLYDLPLEQLDELVVSDVTGYGTTLDEKILEIERLRKLVVDQREQGAGYKMSFDITPVHRRINTVADSAIFIDEIGITLSINGENHIIPLRFSTALEFISGSWKVVHLHGSVAVDTEGDTWHKDEHRKRIEELEKLVAEKTENLLAKNKELEIEASLERVRAVAMSMNKSDDLLSICEISFKEFQKLGFDNLRNTIIHILNDEKGFFLDYDYSDYLSGSINNISYNSHPIVENYLKQIKRADDAFAEVIIDGTQLDGWKDFRRKGGQRDDPKLDDIPALYYYLYSIGVGDIGISTLKPINESQINTLKRFRNVFDLAYRRYTDITQAEAQAREAQIEAALERVRSKTMAMHNSQDVGATVVTLFDEVLKLGLDKSIRVGIGILEGNEGMETWSATSHPNGKVDLKMGMLDMTIHPMLIGLKKAWESGETSYSYDYIGDDVFRYYEALNNEPDYPFQADLNSLPENEYHKSFFYTEGILFSFAPNPISDEAAKVLNRFASVFGQTYRRYLDLRIAEAQAREAKIEASLERVRSKAM